MKMKKNMLIFKKKVVNIKLSEKLIRKVPLIILYDNARNIYIVHGISQFIFDEYGTLKYNSQRVAIDKIIPFLNYMNNNKIKLPQLTFHNGENFLNDLSFRGLSRDTVKKYEKVLSRFYYWLSKNKIIRICQSEFFFNEKNIYERNIKYLSSPFKRIIYNNKQLPIKIQTIRLELVPMFLDTAIRETNIIALGVYFQLFGGLRKGAVVNLKKSSLNLHGINGEYGIELNITKNNLRKDLLDSSGSSEVKKQRHQIVLSVGDNLLPYLYKNHMERYTNKNTLALFTNHNGQAMTGESYEYYFRKLKKAFIKRLLESEDIRLSGYGKVLSTQRWNTHIGRGIFTNLVAESANELQLAAIRGDSDTKTSHIYIRTSEATVKKINNSLNEMYSKFLESDDKNV